MDVLSDVIARSRTGPATPAIGDRYAPWSTTVEEPRAIGFHVVLSGRAWLSRFGADPILLETGDVALVLTGTHTIGDRPRTDDLIPSGAVHATEAAAATPHDETVRRQESERTTMMCGSYAFDAIAINPLLGALPEVLHVNRAAASHEPGLASVVQLLVAEAERDRPGAQSIIDQLTDLIFVYAIRAWTRGRCVTQRDWFTALDDPALTKALSAMHARPEAGWTVESLASVAGLSRAAFSKRFGDRVGTSPMAYLTSWRMRIAAEMLRDGDHGIAKISAAVGYTNEFSFSRAFKRETGSAPTHFRAS